jgi:flagellar biogenesis protein FliO
MENFFHWLLFILTFGCILFIVYVVTRYIAGKARIASKGSHIHVVETISLGQDRRLYLVKAGKRYLLLSSCGKTLSYMTDIDIEETKNIKEEDTEEGKSYGFKSILNKLTGIQPGIYPFRNNLEKLKKMNVLLRKETLEENGVKPKDEE